MRISPAHSVVTTLLSPMNSLILTNNNSQNFSRLLESQTHERDLPREPAFASKGDG